MEMKPENAVVLIPSLEPDERLPRYVRELLEKHFLQIVIVDDGSSEKYQPIFDELAAMDGCTVLHHDVNHGKGVALKTGYTAILKDYPDCAGVITADADGQHLTKDVWALAEKLATGEKALYLGSRDFSQEGVPPKSRTGNRITTFVFWLLYGQWITDTQTGLRAFPASELQFMLDVPGERFEYEMNVLIACARAGIPMPAVTITTVYENANSGTHFHPVRDSIRIYKVIFGNFFRFIGTSLASFLIDQGLFWVFENVALPGLGIYREGAIIGAQVLARVISATCNFTMNKKMVFRLKNGAAGAVWRYAVLCVGILALSTLGVLGLSALGMDEQVAKLICDTLLYFLSYRMQNRWVFREKEGANA